MTLQQLKISGDSCECGAFEAAQKLLFRARVLVQRIQNLEKENGRDCFFTPKIERWITREGEEPVCLLERADIMQEHFGKG